MKKQIITLLSILSIGLVGCKDNNNNQNGNSHQNEEHYVHGDNGEAHTEHIYSDTWVANPQDHLHPCIYENCHHYADVEPHTFICESDETEHWEVCSVCGYEKRNSRQPHVFEEVIDDDYRVPGSTTATGASYYKSCTCGHKSNETFYDNSDYFGVTITTNKYGTVYLESKETLFRVGSIVKFILVPFEDCYPNSLRVNGDYISQYCNNVYEVPMVKGGLEVYGNCQMGRETFIDSVYFDRAHYDEEANGFYSENLHAFFYDETNAGILNDDYYDTNGKSHIICDSGFPKPVAAIKVVYEAPCIDKFNERTEPLTGGIYLIVPGKDTWAILQEENNPWYVVKNQFSVRFYNALVGEETHFEILDDTYDSGYYNLYLKKVEVECVFTDYTMPSIN